MLIIPAIDLLGGRVVRLSKGVESSAVVYSDRPEAVAAEFEAAGAGWLHVVDLDAAFGRPEVNADAIDRVLRSVRIPVELGGGVRDAEKILDRLDRGVSRVILGSAAAENPGLVARALAEHGCDRIAVGIDIRDGRVASRGWTEEGAADYLSLARDMQSLGVRRVIVTEISADGMLTGPKLEPMIRIAAETGMSVIVSGGVGAMSDLDEVDRRGGAAGVNLEAVIVGKALYEKKISLKEAVHRFRNGKGDSRA